MRLRFFGGLRLEGPDGEALSVHGRGQQALLYRLALDAGTAVAYRALAEDVWPDDSPEDPRAALQSLVSRLRRALGADAVVSEPGGYRLAVSRDDVDITAFQDLVAAARRQPEARDAVALAERAGALWTADPWTPGPEFDWVVRDLLEDRAHVERILREVGPAADAGTTSAVASPAVPAALTPLVGRRRELDAIDAQLGAERLVTLIGPGGAGKTTLALETARAWVEATVVVELAPAAPGEVWAAVAAAAGRSIRIADSTTAASPMSSRQRALEALAGRRVLIVLDNCEHVSAEAAEVALALLRATPAARILATSREPLGVSGEAFVDLGPLPAVDAVELFSRRVRAARGAGPEPGEGEVVDRIVRRLDGLPLALELAGARARTLTLAEIDEGLDDRFTLLASGPRTADPRHQTLRALIDWSWETLTATEREALLAASVFPDGIGAGDVATVAAMFQTTPAAFDLLVDRSLLRRGDGRYRMLETVRAYGVDRLRASDREPEARGRQARVMAQLAGEREPLLRGARVRQGLAWFDANDENLSAALRWCGERPGLEETGVALVRASLWPCVMRERFDDLSDGIRRFSSDVDPLDSEAAVVVNGVALMLGLMTAAAGMTGGEAAEIPGFPDFDARRARIAESAARHPSELTAVLPPLLAAVGQAVERHERGWGWSGGFAIPDAAPDAPEWSLAFVSMIRSAVAQNSGDVETLGVESERAVRMFHGLGDIWGIAFASQMRSEWLMLEGRLEEALEVADTSTEGFTGLTSVADLLQQRSQSLGILLRLGRVDEARERLAEIELAARADGSDRAVAQAHMSAATVEIAAGDGEAALRELQHVPIGANAGFPDQMTAWATSKRAQAFVLLERYDEAAADLRTAIPLALRSGDQPIIADVALSLAGWFAGTGEESAARRALTASASLRGRPDDSDPFYRRVASHIGAAPELTSDAAHEELASLVDVLPRP
ncbi:ATP-binding protein [Microbacterium sp. SSM24]|uniref:ATP-binding protein n=1 Tax=Microbacterium sp. SSM24 TaxID=2991714 RepID=UPI002227C530|nr:AAA family ATPase [Microbacterium sp. SSM24]MCW3492404.1 ATPase [Microbacterium sp. SSM24]